MSSAPADDNYSAHFTPKKYVDITIGKTSCQVYPTLTPTMSKAEKAFGFLVSKTAIFQSDAPVRAQLTAFGQTTSTSALVEVMINQYLTSANRAILDASLYLFHSLASNNSNSKQYSRHSSHPSLAYFSWP